MNKANYQLELDPQKRNVFVTQLDQRDEEDDGVHSYPVVQEMAGNLLETGTGTLQKTLLLKKELEIDRVNKDLLAKREEFKLRMESCSSRQQALQKEQYQMKDRVMKFNKFIQENEAKRKRAIQKYQQEVNSKEQKSREYDFLSTQLQKLRERHEYLRHKLAKYKQYEEYLLRVIDILPAHYLEVQDSMLHSLMMRHRTLSATNTTLIESLQTVSDEVEKSRQELDQMNQDHEKMKLSINSQLSQMQTTQEDKVNITQEQEQLFTMKKIHLREQRSEFGQILMAIENIAEKCHRKMDISLEEMSLAQKLTIIQDYVRDKTDVVALVANDGYQSPEFKEKHFRPGAKVKDSKKI